MFFPAERPPQTAPDRLSSVICGLGRVLFSWQMAGLMTAWMARAISERSNGISREIRALLTAFQAGDFAHAAFSRAWRHATAVGSSAGFGDAP